MVTPCVGFATQPRHEGTRLPQRIPRRLTEIQIVMERSGEHGALVTKSPDFAPQTASPRKLGADMIRKLTLAALVLALAATAAAQARHRAPLDANGNLDALVSQYASANNIPESLVRRVIARESGGNPRAVSRGNYGLMQIKLATARGLGYRGDAAGLLDANTNMQYAVKYLAGAWKLSGGSEARA